MKPRIKKIIIGISILSIIGIGIGIYFALHTGKGPQGCGSGEVYCKTTSKCLPSAYCAGKSSDGNYPYKSGDDPCMCTLDCSTLGDDYKGFTQNGLNEVQMIDQGDGTFKPSPDDELFCGKTCKYSTNAANTKGQGGKGWCANKFLCGQMINEQEAHTFSGKCFDSSKFITCPGPNNPDSTICPTNDDCISSGTEERCKSSLCVGESAIPCLTDGDCFANSPAPPAACTIPGFPDKKFQKVGICNTTDMSIIHQNCITNKNSIGENEYGLPIDCSGYEAQIGISNLIEQCPDSIGDGTPASMKVSLPIASPSNSTSCAKHGICSSNKWQAANSPAPSPCVTGGATHCPVSPTPARCNLPDSDCCPHPIGGKCCTVPITSRNPNCLQTTKKPYDALALGVGKSGDSIKYDSTTIDSLSKKFRSSLGLGDSSSTDFKLIPLTLQGAAAESQKYLYGQCGSQVKGDTGKTFIPLLTTSQNTEYCSQKGNCVKAAVDWNPNGVSAIGTPLCLNGGDLYWSHADGGTTSFTQSYSGATGGGECSPTDLINEMLTEYSGVTGITPVGSPAPYSDIKYDVNCDGLDVTLPDGSKAWTDLIKPETWTDNNATKFTGSNNARIAETCDPTAISPHCYIPHIDSPHCTGETNRFPPAISKAPRIYNNSVCFGNDTISGIKYMSHTGENCVTDFKGKCT